MRIKDVYINNKHRKVCPIEKLYEENVDLISKPWEIIKQYKLRFILGLVSLVIILFLVFNNYLPTFAISCGFLAFLIITCIIINTYSLKCNDDSLHMELNIFQKFDLPYNRILNIYLGKEFNSTSFMPKVNYNLTIRYIDNLNFIKELSFPTLFLKPEQINEFLNNFIVVDEDDDTCIKYEKYKIIKKVLKFGGFLLFIIAIGVVVFISLKK